ncbi:MAG: hypothetical protein U0R27_08645 [Candidatus Nanopelagicales bacterium]
MAWERSRICEVLTDGDGWREPTRGAQWTGDHVARRPRRLPEAATARIHHLQVREPFAVAGAPATDAFDVVLKTSGSAGAAKAVGHSFAAVEWAAATARRVLHDEGWRWLLMIGPFATGGFMTVARSVPAPLVWPGAGGTEGCLRPDRLVRRRCAGHLAGEHQLARLLAIPAGVRLLQSMQVVLVGGGRSPRR